MGKRNESTIWYNDICHVDCTLWINFRGSRFFLTQTFFSTVSHQKKMFPITKVIDQ